VDVAASEFAEVIEFVRVAVLTAKVAVDVAAAVGDSDLFLPSDSV
jgi:hypothetical protein